MRIKKALKNIFYSLGSYVLLMVAGIFIRKLFIMHFDIELLGYESLFGSVFIILSMAEMGAGGMFNYMLYRAVAEHDDHEISTLMQMFKQLYRVVGVVVAVLGCILFLFLPLFVNPDVENWNYVCIVYWIQLATTLTTYFLAYRRSILIANQCEYEVVKVETNFKMLNMVLRIGAIVLLQSYTVYLLISVFCNVLANFQIWRLCGKKYPNIKNVPIGLQDYQKRGVFTELKNLLISKISSTIWSSSDNILINAFLGIRITAIYGGYTMIYSAVNTVVSKCTQPMVASVGNLMYEKPDKNRIKQFYEAYNLFCGFAATFCFVAFIVMFQPFLEFVYGKEYLLPMAFVVALSANGYAGIKQQAICAFRNSMGNYRLDRNYSICSAALNVLLSILLAGPFGITGITVATVVAHMVIWLGRLIVVHRHYFGESLFSEITKETVWIILAALEGGVVLWICTDLSASVSGIILRGIACVVIPNLINLALFFHTASFQYMWHYAKKTFCTLGGKLKEKQVEQLRQHRK